MQRNVCKRLSIRGRVQGVGYRAAAAEEARMRGLVGWVRNRRDGSVEALVCGAADAVEEYVRWARQGPPAAGVTGVEPEDADLPEAIATGFEVRPTA